MWKIRSAIEYLEKICAEQILRIRAFLSCEIYICMYLKKCPNVRAGLHQKRFGTNVSSQARKFDSTARKPARGLINLPACT